VHAGGKRKLQSSHRTTAWLLWPFALWGIILVALYMAAYSSIANISSPLATLNIVNFVAIRFTRTIFFAQASEYVAADACGACYLLPLACLYSVYLLAPLILMNHPPCTFLRTATCMG
jgi:hypothetical protein